jgi:alpha-glucosidase
VSLESKLSEWAAIARRKGRDWFVGALGDWEPHDITIDLSFLGPGKYEAEFFSDGVNADKEATDFVRDVKKVSSVDRLDIHLAHGGGWAARIHRVE